MSLYMPVKYALMILLGIGIVFLIVYNLVPELNRSKSDTRNVVILVVQLFVLIIGFCGAYRDNRQLLLTFALILAILIIVAVVQSQAVAVVGNAVIDIVSIVLAVYQAEMIRTGDR